MLRLLTAGESHGKAMIALLDGFPSGLQVRLDQINSELRRRQGGYGRGGRQKIESDTVEMVSGTWRGVTLGSPICMQIANKDHKLEKLKELPRPRPGHGDLSGSLKYHSSIRGILERASARETAARVAAGALAHQLLQQLNIRCFGYVVELGGVAVPPAAEGWHSQLALREQSAVYSLDPNRDAELKQLIDLARDEGDTLGGIIEVRVEGVPFGLGSHAQWDRKLDGQLARAVMSIQAIKGVEIGVGFQAARLPGSQVHDPIQYDAAQAQSAHAGYLRPTNHAGGLEAGMSNGQPIVIRAAKKPISTLRKPLESIDMDSKQPSVASYERSDVCAVPAASVIMENVVALEIASAVTDKFGGDSLQEIRNNLESFLQLVRQH